MLLFCTGKQYRTRGSRILKLPPPGTRTEYLAVAATATFTQGQRPEMSFKHLGTHAVDINALLGIFLRLEGKITNSKPFIVPRKVASLLFHSEEKLLVQ